MRDTQKKIALGARGVYTLGMELKRYLAKNGLTLADFAAQIDRNVSTVSRIIRGEQMPSPETIRAIMKATRNRVKANDFIGGAE